MSDVIFDRRSIRKYENKPVETEKLKYILRAAMYAPSACDRRPWHFIVYTEEAAKRALSATHPSAAVINNAPAAVVICGDTSKEISPGYFMVDCGLSMENMVLAAAKQGLGSCILGVCPVKIRMNTLSEFLKLPDHIKPYAIVTLGYPAEKRSVPERYDDTLIHYAKW